MFTSVNKHVLHHNEVYVLLDVSLWHYCRYSDSIHLYEVTTKAEHLSCPFTPNMMV